MKKLLALSIYLVILLNTQLFARDPALDSAIKYYNIGYYSKAIEYGSAAYRSITRPITKLSYETVETITLMAEIQSALLNYRSAIPYYDELLDLFQNTKGSKDLYYESVYNLGSLLAGDGNFREMDSLYDFSIRNSRTKVGIRTLFHYQITTLLEYKLDDKAYALNDSLDDEFYYLFNEYDDDSDELYFEDREETKNYLDSLADARLKEYQTKEKTDELEFAVLLFEIGWRYDSLEFFHEADSVFAYCENYASEHLGLLNEISIQCLLKRAEEKKTAGDYFRAFELIKKAEPVAKAAYGENTVLYGDILRYMGDYLMSLGRGDEALDYFENALRIFQSQLSLVNNLYSALIMDMAAGKDITALLNEIIEATEERGVYCNSCYSYLLLIQAKELEKKFQIAEAESLYYKALENLPGFDEEGSAEIEVAMADFYVRCRTRGFVDSLLHFGIYKPFEEDGKQIWRIVARDPEDPYYNDRLEGIYDESIAQSIEKFGRLHPAVAELEFAKSLLYWGWKPQFETIVQFNKTLKVYLEITGSIFPFLTETERISFYNSIKTALESFTAYIISEKLEKPTSLGSSYAYKDLTQLKNVIGDDTLNFRIRRLDSLYYRPEFSAPGILLNYRLATKGLIYESVTKTRKRILESNDSQLIEKFRTWQSLREMVAAIQPGQEIDNAMGGRIDSLAQAADSLERWLSVRSEEFRNQNENLRITWNDLLPCMGVRDAAIEVIRCHHPMYYRLLGTDYEDSVYYGFLVLSNNRRDKVSLVINPNGHDLETRYYQYYSNSIKYRQEDTLSQHWFWGDIEKALRDTQGLWYGNIKNVKFTEDGVITREFDKALQAYTDSLMKTEPKIYFSADGIYNKINLNTLRWQGKFIIDRYNIHMLSNLKELLQVNKLQDTGNKESTQIGNPDFGNKETGIDPDTLKERSVDISNLMRSGLEALPGTAKEVQLIGNSLSENGWKVSRYEGIQASESNLKKVHSPDILHIATHGFFNDEVSTGNPLFNCGLLMSEIGEEVPSGDDGIFTGLEALDLDLRGCRLVVLSACESGLGKVETGEGVYGLQRAFSIAEASGTLMSLWKVNDTATQELMSVFYKNLSAGHDVYSSFKSAQLSLRNKYKHPYYWGAFVFSGI